MLPIHLFVVVLLAQSSISANLAPPIPGEAFNTHARQPSLSEHTRSNVATCNVASTSKGVALASVFFATFGRLLGFEGGRDRAPCRNPNWSSTCMNEAWPANNNNELLGSGDNQVHDVEPVFPRDTTTLASARTDLTPPSSTASLAVQSCVSPSPDIAGVGVRASIYVQALLSFTPILASVFGFLDFEKEKLLHSIYVNLLFTACVLLLSAFIQKATFGLSIYHALIVLNLSWIVTASSLMLFIIPTIHWQSRISFKDWARRLWPSKLSQIPALWLFFLHLSLTAAFGIWVWSKVDVSGNHLTPKSFMTILFHDIPVVDSALRTSSLVLYSAAAIPGVNVAVLTAATGLLSFALVFLWCRLWRPYFVYTHLYVTTLAIQLLISIALIVNTEVTILRSKSVPIVCDGESNWTFGQTLAVALAVRGALDIVKFYLPSIRRTYLGGRVVGGVEYWLRRRLRRSEREWDAVCHSVKGNIRRAQDALARSTRVSKLEMFRKPILHALETAEAAVEASNGALNPPDNNLDDDWQIEDEEKRERIRKRYSEVAMYVASAYEDIGTASSLRFASQDKMKVRLFTSKAYLEAALAAFSATAASLKAVDRVLVLEGQTHPRGRGALGFAGDKTV